MSLAVTVTLAVLVTFKTTGTTVMLASADTSVSFSLHLTFTTLVILPATVAFTVTVNQILTELPAAILETSHVKGEISSIVAPLSTIMPHLSA